MTVSRDLSITALASSEANLEQSYVKTLVVNNLEKLLGPAGKAPNLNLWIWKFRNASTDFESLSTNAFEKLRLFSATSGLEALTYKSARELVVSINASQLQLKPEFAAKIASERQAPSLALLSIALRSCATLPDLVTFGAGSLEMYQKKANDARNEYADYQDQLDSAQKILAQAKGDYQREVKATTPREVSPLKRFSDAASKLAAAVDKLGSAGAKLPLAEDHAAALEKLDALETLLRALATGETDATKMTEDQQHAIAVVRSIPAVFTEADKLFKEAAKPRIAPFIIAMEQQRLLVEGMIAQQALLKRKVEASTARVEAALAETRALGYAKLSAQCDDFSDEAALSGCAPINFTLRDLQNAKDWKQRRRIYGSFAAYFEDAFRARLKRTAAEQQLNALIYETGMAKSKNAAQRWENLVSNTSAVLADYHASGLKTAEIAEFVKGLGLFYIGRQTGQ